MATFNYQQPGIGNPPLRAALAAVVAELAKVRAAYTLLITKLDGDFTKFNAVLTKLDADAGVTDTNYNATQAAAITYVSADQIAANEFVP